MRFRFVWHPGHSSVGLAPLGGSGSNRHGRGLATGGGETNEGDGGDDRNHRPFRLATDDHLDQQLRGASPPAAVIDRLHQMIDSLPEDAVA